MLLFHLQSKVFREQLLILYQNFQERQWIYELKNFTAALWRVDKSNTMIADGNCQFSQLLIYQNLLNINNKFYKYFFGFHKIFSKCLKLRLLV